MVPSGTNKERCTRCYMCVQPQVHPLSTIGGTHRRCERDFQRSGVSCGVWSNVHRRWSHPPHAVSHALPTLSFALLPFSLLLWSHPGMRYTEGVKKMQRTPQVHDHRFKCACGVLCIFFTPSVYRIPGWDQSSKENKHDKQKNGQPQSPSAYRRFVFDRRQLTKKK